MFQSEFDLGVLGMDIIAVFCSLLWSSFFCYFGNLAADHVSEIGDAAYGLNWFEHPLEIQKYVILIMARSNERVAFSGFHLITCSMEKFGKVRNAHAKSIQYSILTFNNIFSSKFYVFFGFSSLNQHARIMPFSENYHSDKHY